MYLRLTRLIRWWQVPYYWLGCKAYDLVAGNRGLETSYFLTSGKAMEQFPMLKGDNLCGAIVYYDGMLFLCVFIFLLAY